VVASSDSHRPCAASFTIQTLLQRLYFACYTGYCLATSACSTSNICIFQDGCFLVRLLHATMSHHSPCGRIFSGGIMEQSSDIEMSIHRVLPSIYTVAWQKTWRNSDEVVTKCGPFPVVSRESRGGRGWWGGDQWPARWWQSADARPTGVTGPRGSGSARVACLVREVGTPVERMALLAGA
jgi:hypothetical protein